jgi:hypothetical protein
MSTHTEPTDAESATNRRTVLRTATALALAGAGITGTAAADDGVGTESCSCSCSCTWEYDCLYSSCDGFSYTYAKRKVCNTDCGTVKGDWQKVSCGCPT